MHFDPNNDGLLYVNLRCEDDVQRLPLFLRSFGNFKRMDVNINELLPKASHILKTYLNERLAKLEIYFRGYIAFDLRSVVPDDGCVSRIQLFCTNNSWSVVQLFKENRSIEHLNYICEGAITDYVRAAIEDNKYLLSIPWGLKVDFKTNLSLKRKRAFLAMENVVKVPDLVKLVYDYIDKDDF